ncbi:MAG: hypothetical protein RI565_07270 [Schleiferiaceae bacterium]|jgi:hypothetical protein|nr:hypothetical protein [Schleiferiaceae bacterium]
MSNPKNAMEVTRVLARRFVNWIFQGNTRVKILFLVLSAVLWLLIKLSKPGYENEVKLPLVIQNIPEEQVLVSTSHDKLSLRLRSNGFNLLKYSFWRYNEVELDLNDLPPDSSLTYHWDSQEMIRELTDQLSKQVKVLSVQPDTISVALNRMITRAVPVKSQIEWDPTGPRVLYEAPRSEPAEVKVTGPREQVEAIDTLYTEKWRLGAPDKDSLQRALKLDLPANQALKYQQNKVRVTVKLARLTEKTVSVPVVLRHQPADLELELFPSQIEVIYQVALRDYSAVNAKGFELFIDLQEEQLGPEQRFLSVQVGTIPPPVRNYRLARKRVEYIAKAL